MNNENLHFAFGILFSCTCSFGWCLHFFSSFEIFIYTIYFDLIGYLQAYKLVVHCRSLQGNCYCRGFFRFVLCSHARVRFYGFCCLNCLLCRCQSQTCSYFWIRFTLLVGRPSSPPWLVVFTKPYYSDQIKTGQISWTEHVAGKEEMINAYRLLFGKLKEQR
jgi:hypothetical protein